MMIGIGIGISARNRGGGSSSNQWSDAVSAFLASSYSSGQVWGNSISTPADGSTQAAHDFYLGETSSVEANDPAISSGPPVGWVFSSGDRMSLAHASVSTVPAFYRNMHMTGSMFTLMVYGRWNGSLNTGICPVFDSGTSDQNGGDVSRGVYFCNFGADGKIRIKVLRDSDGISALNVASDSAMPSNTDMVFGVSVDGTGASQSFLYLDGTQPLVAGSPTFNGILSSPGSTQTVNTPKLMARGDAVHTTNVVTLYGLAIFNRNLTLSEMDAVAAFLQA